jgi:sigma-B regulation protein RsbU (phosphoserine phosphatase)
VLYTAGVTEAQDREHNEPGDERLLAEIRRQDGGSVTALQRRIQVAIQGFVGGAPQFDDLTAMVVGREGSSCANNMRQEQRKTGDIK